MLSNEPKYALWASFLDIFGVMVLSDTKWSLKHVSDDYV